MVWTLRLNRLRPDLVEHQRQDDRQREHDQQREDPDDHRVGERVPELLVVDEHPDVVEAHPLVAEHAAARAEPAERDDVARGSARTGRRAGRAAAGPGTSTAASPCAAPSARSGARRGMTEPSCAIQVCLRGLRDFFGFAVEGRRDGRQRLGALRVPSGSCARSPPTRAAASRTPPWSAAACGRRSAGRRPGGARARRCRRRWTARPAARRRPGSTIRAPNRPVNAVTSAGTVNVTSADSPGLELDAGVADEAHDGPGHLGDRVVQVELHDVGAGPVPGVGDEDLDLGVAVDRPLVAGGAGRPGERRVGQPVAERERGGRVHRRDARAPAQRRGQVGARLAGRRPRGC